jgi:hypothetical protein
VAQTRDFIADPAFGYTASAGSTEVAEFPTGKQDIAKPGLHR